MLELIRHTLGFCGEHWHPNIWTALASSPLIASSYYFLKCKCGGWFKHKKRCRKKV